ncbi:type IV pilus secretin PilQ [Neptunicella marina]|uniref:Type IV pilus secretin PilQ family protein n=1 Tax=Neptunicella marina TaxID=2125989 RepID=A0A8J6M0Q8_9ALTE|nr:type IV pilus secretin PilQ family protein [Neptunicella marina]MBC3767615.1 type IV pilus secretin PilQ family protein [Neptunicella marina]
MSERYIFNKKLNKPNRAWGWLSILVLSMLAYKVVAQESQLPDLVDPDAKTTEILTTRLQNVDFHRTEAGGGSIAITFDKEEFAAEIDKGKNTLIVTLPGVEVDKEQLYKLDLADFAANVTMLETFQDPDGARIEIKVEGNYAVLQQKTQKNLMLEIEPVAETANQDSVESAYEGAPISLDFQDVPVRQVLQIIAQVNGFNLVTTDSVNGNVTISLAGVPWDQALSMIMKIKGLDKRLEGNILLIAPAEELASREAQQLQSKQQVAELAPLSSANVQINYAKAADMAEILKSNEGGILSPRGSVSVDNRTNILLIKDTDESIAQARAMINALDIPVKQVLIESRMVTVRDNITDELGVRWGFSDQQDSDGISGSLEGANAIASGNIPSLSDRLNVNLPVSGAAGRFGLNIARLADGTILDLELSAMEQENKGEIIASPRLTVANQHDAYIEQGTEIPYVQATSSGATSVEFKKAVLSLKVTPHITPDNRIILDLVITQDTRGDTVQTSTGPAVAIDTQEIATQVLVENGETIVLGGIFQQNATNANTQVPVLGDIPLLGHLFRNKREFNEKRELLIFVTPKIINQSL